MAPEKELVHKLALGKPLKKVLFLVAGPLRGGGSLNGCASKDIFFNVRKKVPMANKPREGGGLKALMALRLH